MKNSTHSQGYAKLAVGQLIVPTEDTDAWSCGLRHGRIVEKLAANKLLPRTIIVDFQGDLRWLRPNQVARIINERVDRA